MIKVFFVLFFLLLFTLPLFAQSVDTAWVRRYNGLGNSTDWASAMAVDGSGNIYVTGHSAGSGTGVDYVTIKYYPNGDTAWVRRYNAPGNSWDGAYALAVDGSGNVYVTGGSYDTGTYWDYATIKYNPQGDTAWVRIYNGLGNGDDQAYALTVNDIGNIYVIGGSFNNGTYDDYATIKYDLNGDTVWVRRYNGPGNAYDDASAIAVDGWGNIYVTGASSGSGTYNDYATIKYYPDGETAWVRRYNGPANFDDLARAIAVDDSGNIYVTGHGAGSGTDVDYATIKYYPNGNTAWVRRYNGPGNSWDGAYALAVDGSGNAYVTGHSYGSGTYEDYATIKYYPDGDTAWVRRYNGIGNRDDNAWAIAVDDSGNVYVTGESHGSETDWDYDYATIKYYPNGDTAWVRRYHGPGNIEDCASAITVDCSGNVYVTGYSWNGTDYDYATIKYVQFVCGDASIDGVVNSADVIYLINYLFIGGPAPVPIQAGDANGDGVVNSADVAYLINYLFVDGPAPCE